MKRNALNSAFTQAKGRIGYSCGVLLLLPFLAFLAGCGGSSPSGNVETGDPSARDMSAEAPMESETGASETSMAAAPEAAVQPATEPDSSTQTPAAANSETQKTGNSIVGKTQSEVLALLGSPRSKQGNRWVYPQYSLEFGPDSKVVSFGKNEVPDVLAITQGGQKIQMNEVLAPGKITMVDFYADWCGPCKVLSPKLEQIAKNDPDVVLRKVDIVKWGTPVALQFNLSSIPSVWVYNGQGRQIGAATYDFNAIQKNVAAAKSATGR